MPSEPAGCPGWPPELPLLSEPDGLWLPWDPLLWPDWGSEAGEPDGLEDGGGELEDEPPVLDGDEVGGGMPPGEPDEPGLLLGGDELGTGMLGGLGWVMTVCDRQPDSSSPPKAVTAKRGWLGPVMDDPPPQARRPGRAVPWS